MFHRSRNGFTLVELLVVIAIIGVLVALLLPAVQSARESARYLQCKNNLKQIALAATMHHDVHKHFPAGGWGLFWVGDPDRGFGERQPGGWIYSILPYIEQDALRRIGAGQTDAQKRDSLLELVKTPIPALNCPSRRAIAAYTYNPTSKLRNVNLPELAARSCYAGNGGSFKGKGADPPSFEVGDRSRFRWPFTGKINGLIFVRSTISMREITDGTTNTMFAGEKHLVVAHYETGKDGGDNQPMYQGYDVDTVRFTNRTWPPKHDALNEENFDINSFGSAHPVGINFAMCDGSVQTLNYDVNLEVYERLGNRADGQPFDLSEL